MSCLIQLHNTPDNAQIVWQAEIWPAGWYLGRHSGGIAALQLQGPQFDPELRLLSV